jgi:hypothetical protein
MQGRIADIAFRMIDKSFAHSERHAATVTRQEVLNVFDPPEPVLPISYITPQSQDMLEFHNKRFLVPVWHTIKEVADIRQRV